MILFNQVARNWRSISLSSHSASRP